MTFVFFKLSNKHIVLLGIWRVNWHVTDVILVCHASVIVSYCYLSVNDGCLDEKGSIIRPRSDSKPLEYRTICSEPFAAAMRPMRYRHRGIPYAGRVVNISTRLCGPWKFAARKSNVRRVWCRSEHHDYSLRRRRRRWRRLRLSLPAGVLLSVRPVLSRPAHDPVVPVTMTVVKFGFRAFVDWNSIEFVLIRRGTTHNIALPIRSTTGKKANRTRDGTHNRDGRYPESLAPGVHFIH